MFRDKQAKVLIFLVCMILGIMLATQFKSAENAKNSISQQRVEDLAERLKTAEKDKANLTEEIKKLHKHNIQIILFIYLSLFTIVGKFFNYFLSQFCR